MFSRREILQAGGAWVGARAIESVMGKEPELGRTYPITRIKTEMPYICIGIDDGWDPENVERFLEITAAYEYTLPDGTKEPVKFTLFPVGTVLELYPELWRRVKAAGHEIGNHSYNHIYASGSNKRTIKWSFREFERVYGEVFGREIDGEFVPEPYPEPKIARVPFAESVNPMVQEALFEIGYYLSVHWRWNGDTYSWRRGTTTEKALKNIGDLTQGDIAVMHFTDLDMDILKDVLDHYAEKGLRNKRFTDLYAARKKK